jgi:hypothetical protein
MKTPKVDFILSAVISVVRPKKQHRHSNFLQFYPEEILLQRSSLLIEGSLIDLIRPVYRHGGRFREHHPLSPAGIAHLSGALSLKSENLSDPQTVPCFYHNSFPTCRPPALKRSRRLRISSSSPTVLAFAYVHGLGLLFQSPVVRSERSKTDELTRFAFATTCRFTKLLTRTC